MLTLYTLDKQIERNNNSYKIADLVGKDKKIGDSGQLNGKKTALISGAGIAGLAAAFELKAKGFDVIIVEKRSDFSRFNVINLNKEAQAFLRKFNLLEEFETSVAARIQEHQIVICGNEGVKLFDSSDVSKLQFEGPLNTDPTKFKDLFKEDGIYSVQIRELQAFLARKAAQIGIQILSESEIKIDQPLANGRVSKIEITQKNGSLSPLIITPDLFVIAEGAHSSSAEQLKMVNDEHDVVKNACTGENWIFGNAKYRGDKTFVISMIITAQKTLQIANVIFNAKNKIVNVTVTSDEKNLNQVEMNRLILETAKKAFDFAKIKEEIEILETVKQPVHITNRIASICSRGNVFRIGDAVGHSSPLAGLGGTLGLTLVPCTVEKLLNDHQNGSHELHDNFKAYSQAYVRKWIDKSVMVKEFIQGVFKKELAQSEEVEYAI